MRFRALLAAERARFDAIVGFRTPKHAERASYWYLGFVRTLRLEREEGAPAIVRALLSDSSTWFLSELELALDATDDASIDLLFAAPRASLRTLSIARAGDPECPHADLLPWTMLPRLEQLRLEGQRIVHDLVHPGVRELWLAGSPMCEPSWQLPQLTKLAWLHPDVDAFAGLCDAAPPALRELQLFCVPESQLRAQLGELVRGLPDVQVMWREPIRYRWVRGR